MVWVAFIVGLIIGGCAGCFAMGLLVASRERGSREQSLDSPSDSEHSTPSSTLSEWPVEDVTFILIGQNKTLRHLLMNSYRHGGN